MDGDMMEFHSLMTKLLDVNNDVRTKAEEDYDKVPAGARARLLLNLTAQEAVSMEVRQLSIVLLRRLFSTDFDKYSGTSTPDAVNQMKIDILALVKTPIDAVLKRKICDAAAELAKNFLDDDGNNLWPDFLNSLFECVNSSDLVLKECALNMFAYVPGVFGNQQSRYLDVIRQMLIHCLAVSPTTDLNVRTSAVKATSSFALLHYEEKPIVKQLQECIPLIIAFVAETMLMEGEHCEAGLNCLVELSEKCPQLLRIQFNTIIELCIKALEEEQVLEARKHLALEIIVSLAEAAPATMRKRGAAYLPKIIQQLLQMMTEVEDDSDWTVADVVEDEDYESDAVIGETSLDRLSCSVGGKVILPIVVANINLMLRNPDWRHRHAAMMAVSAVGEGSHTQMLPLLPELVDGILPYLRDAHHRVRHSACNALGQMATDFSPDFQEKFHTKIIPELLTIMDDQSNPRVQAHAGAALVNFFEDCSTELIANYIHPVALKLEEILKRKMEELSKNGTKLVLEQTVVTLASLADAAQENFVNYYDVFVPSLKFIIANATADNLKVLRGKAIECVSLIGLAVGKDKFCSDATDVMDMLLRAQTGEIQLADDDPQMSYMISAWARICKILGPQFEPYLPYVMGPVLRAANIKIEVALLDRDDVSTVQQETDWQCVSLGEQQTFGIKTTGLEEKATACAMLVCYARELKHSFIAYVEETVKIMVPLLKFYFHDDVRAAAAECLPYLLDSAQAKGNDYVKQLWTFIAPELMKAVECEPEREVLCEMIGSLAQIIEKLGTQFITPEQLEILVHVLDEHLKDHFQRAQQRGEKRKDEDYDEGVEEILEDEDDEDVYALSKVSDILHSCFSVFKADFLPYFDKIVHHFKHLAAPDRSWNEHQWAICVFDDVIEHGSPHSIKYKDLFLPLLRDGVQSNRPEIRQAASYGFGVLAKCGGDIYGQTCAESLPLLATMITTPDSRSEDNINATENAIAAVTKILQFNAGQINVNEVLPTWLSWLPVWEDEEELPVIYEFLLFLIENNHPLILGENNCNLPRIVAIFGESLARTAIDLPSPLGQKVTGFLKTLQQNGAILEGCVASLSQEQQLAIQQVLIS
ncbi:Importin-5 [Halotydeus destructor]|nr:Importin-5 [Halotydeus destructor]